jgi:hypothetical protein
MRQALSILLGGMVALAGAVVVAVFFMLTALYAFYSFTFMSGVALGMTGIVGSLLIGSMFVFNRLIMPLSHRLIVRHTSPFHPKPPE